MTDKVQIGDATLYHGDCLDWFDTLPKCFGADAFITDPPYGVGLTGKSAKQRDGSVRFRDDNYVGFEDTPEYVQTVAVPAIKKLDEICIRGALTPGTRNMFFYHNPRDVGCFFSAAGTGLGRWGFTCMQPIYYYGKDPYLQLGLGGRANSCGQTYPNDANEIAHPCAKPIRQMMWLVNRASAADDLVIDPFMGSGTTGVACINLGRKFIGIEIELQYFDIACERINRAYNQPRLFGEVAQAIEQKSFQIE